MAHLDKFTGALLIAVILSTVLFGILTLQTYFCLVRYPDDRSWIRRMVITLWVVDFIHQACACHATYIYLTDFRHPEVLARVTWSISAFHSLEPILALVAQIFFVHRLHLLNRNWWPIVLIASLLAGISFALGFAASIITFLLTYWSEFARYTWVVVTWLAACAACDILIAGAIATSLFLSRSGVKSTDRIISKLIMWTINTGAFPALFAILELVFFLALNTSFIYPSVDIVLAKLYSNSLLAFLNRRQSPFDSKNEQSLVEGEIHLTTVDLRRTAPNTFSSQVPPRRSKSSESAHIVHRPTPPLDDLQQ